MGHGRLCRPCVHTGGCPTGAPAAACLQEEPLQLVHGEANLAGCISHAVSRTQEGVLQQLLQQSTALVYPKGFRLLRLLRGVAQAAVLQRWLPGMQSTGEGCSQRCRQALTCLTTVLGVAVQSRDDDVQQQPGVWNSQRSTALHLPSVYNMTPAAGHRQVAFSSEECLTCMAMHARGRPFLLSRRGQMQPLKCCCTLLTQEYSPTNGLTCMVGRCRPSPDMVRQKC